MTDFWPFLSSTLLLTQNFVSSAEASDGRAGRIRLLSNFEPLSIVEYLEKFLTVNNRLPLTQNFGSSDCRAGQIRPLSNFSHLSNLKYLKKFLEVKIRPAFNLRFGNFFWINFLDLFFSKYSRKELLRIWKSFKFVRKLNWLFLQIFYSNMIWEKILAHSADLGLLIDICCEVHTGVDPYNQKRWNILHKNINFLKVYTKLIMKFYTIVNILTAIAAQRLEEYGKCKPLPLIGMISNWSNRFFFRNNIFCINKYFFKRISTRLDMRVFGTNNYGTIFPRRKKTPSVLQLSMDHVTTEVLQSKMQKLTLKTAMMDSNGLLDSCTERLLK